MRSAPRPALDALLLSLSVLLSLFSAHTPPPVSAMRTPFAWPFASQTDATDPERTCTDVPPLVHSVPAAGGSSGDDFNVVFIGAGNIMFGA